MKRVLLLSAGVLFGMAIWVENSHGGKLLDALRNSKVGQKIHNIKQRIQGTKTGQAVLSGVADVASVGKEVVQLQAIEVANNNIIVPAVSKIEALQNALSSYKNQIYSSVSTYKQQLFSKVQTMAGGLSNACANYLNNINNLSQQIVAYKNAIATYSTNISALNQEITAINQQMQQTSDPNTLNALKTNLTNYENQKKTIEAESAKAQAQLTVVQNQQNAQVTELRNTIQSTNNAELVESYNLYTSTLSTLSNLNDASCDLALLKNNVTMLSNNIARNVYSNVKAVKQAVQAYNIVELSQRIQTTLAATPLAENAKTLYLTISNLNNIDDFGVNLVNVGTNVAVNRINSYNTPQPQTTVPNYSGQVQSTVPMQQSMVPVQTTVPNYSGQIQSTVPMQQTMMPVQTTVPAYSGQIQSTVPMQQTMMPVQQMSTVSQ